MFTTELEENQMRERILSLIHQERITERRFAVMIGKEPANLHKCLSGERHLPRGLCSEIIKAFPHVNREWLAWGEGEMYISKEESAKREIPTETKPRLPKTLCEGHLPEYYLGEKRDLCQEKPVIRQFPDYDFTLIVKNCRMAPNYRIGDEIAFKKATIIEWGSDYLLDTPEGPKFKKIYEEKDSVRCVSYNKDEFPEFKIPKNMILGYYRVVGVLRVL